MVQSGGNRMNYSPYSDLKVFYHTESIKGLLQGDRVVPIYVRIKPTNICNQKCHYCVYADNKVFDSRVVDHRESIPWIIMQKTLNELRNLGTKAITFSGGGDPLCYKYILDTFELVKKIGFDCSIITNGQALCGDVVDYIKDFKWIRISFDSACAETYKAIRSVNTYERVLSNMSNFSQIKSKDCTFGINCVVTKNNADEIYNICKLVKDIGVDNIKVSPALVKEDEYVYHNEIKKKVCEQLARAKSELASDRFAIVDKYTNDLTLSDHFEKSYNRCWIQELFTVIAADSKIYRCHQRAYMDEGYIGDLRKDTFTNIWFSNQVAENVKNFDAKKYCDFRCAFEERNILLNDFMNQDLNHINFI